MTITELTKQEDGSFKCPYCNKTYIGLGGLCQHVRFTHNRTTKDMYDSFCKRKNDGICIICGNPTPFKYGKYALTCSAECKAEWYSIDQIRALKISQANRKFNTESFIEQANEIHGDKFDYSPTKVTTLRGRIEIICKKHGSFETVATYHLLDMYGGCRKCASESMVITKLSWPEEKKNAVNEARRRTNKERFGNTRGPMPFGSEAYRNLILEKYGVENPFCSEEIKEKIKETNRKKYGVDNPAYLEKTKLASHTKQANKKRYLTHKKNNSFNTSKPEEDFYEFLISLFGEKDVFHNYADDPRYPFACDFYIKSLDLFIELNLYFTHGFHWFNQDDSDDIAKLALWQKRTNGNDLYSGAIKVWTILDPMKKETAEKNKINYVVLWNLEEIERYKNELSERVVFKRINNLA